MMYGGRLLYDPDEIRKVSKAEGIVETAQEMGASNAEIESKLMTKLSMTATEAAECLREYGTIA